MPWSSRSKRMLDGNRRPRTMRGCRRLCPATTGPSGSPSSSRRLGASNGKTDISKVRCQLMKKMAWSRHKGQPIIENNNLEE